MVCVVHMNIFYKLDLQSCDPKSEFLRHAHFEEIAILLIFGQNVDLDTPRDSQEALWRLSGSSQETL